MIGPMTMFWLGQEPCELPQAEQEKYLSQANIGRLREQSIDIVPGVRVALMGMGQAGPGGPVGARIAVWDERPARTRRERRFLNGGRSEPGRGL